MRKELDALLCQRYPRIFEEREGHMRETAMCWGFSCGDGWFELIDALCECLQFWTDHNRAPQVVACQVKEKWGVLSFYPRGEVSEEQRGMILMTEAMSARICDQCGRPGTTIVHESWCMTRCPEHAPAGAVDREDFPTRGMAP